MSRFVYAAVFASSLALGGAAWAQNGAGTGSGMDSNSRSMSGPNINVDNGILANGTPKQQEPGESMTNGPSNGGLPGTLNGDGVPKPGGPAATAPNPTAGTVKPTGPTGQTGN